MDLQVCDVEADGDCFYSCVVRCLSQDVAILKALLLPRNPDLAVSRLREAVAYCVEEDDEVRGWIRRLLLLNKATGGGISLREDNPLLEDASSLSDMAHNIVERRVWASQLEVLIAQKLTGGQGVALLVLEGGCSGAARQLMSAVQNANHKRCIVVIRVNQCHYQFLSMHPSHGRIFDTDWLMWRAACMEAGESPPF